MSRNHGKQQRGGRRHPGVWVDMSTEKQRPTMVDHRFEDAGDLFPELAGVCRVRQGRGMCSRPASEHTGEVAS